VSKIRIAFVASTLEVGGAENVLANLIARLPQDRFETELVLLRKPGAVGDRLAREGARCVDSIEHRRGDPRVAGRLAAHFRSLSPRIVYCLDHHNAMFWGRIASLLSRVPRRVLASHSTGRMDGRRSFTRIDQFLMRWTDAVVALSDSHARYLRDVEGIDARKIIVIENGIDTTRYAAVDEGRIARLRSELGLSTGDRVVAMVAALRPEKAHDAFLEAAKRIVTRRPDLPVKFLVVGGGPRQEAISAMRQTLGVENRVLLLGEREDVAEILHVSSVLALPSHGAVETLPLAVLEAMAAGVPVVASAVGSIPEIIENGVNGRLIAPADPIGLSDAICHIFDDSEETRSIISRAGETVRRRYTVEKMISGYVELFERLNG
jgi:glycosyltransferase involved in cell wall biosynthesis